MSREPGESIVIDGGRIVVKVIDSNTRKARIGVIAPREIAVDREEVHLRKLADGGRKGGRP